MYTRSVLLNVVTGLAIGTGLRIIEMKVEIIGIIGSGGLVAQGVDVGDIVAENLKALRQALEGGNSVVKRGNHDN